MKRAAARFTIVAILGALLASAHDARAQSPRGLTLRMDNDAFDFWMQPYNRPDEEYTSGVHITYDGARAPWWSGWLLGSAAMCTYHVTDCRRHAPRSARTSILRRQASTIRMPRPGSRANGGWLYVAQTARSLHESRSDELTISVGVTGPPSLARFTQNLAHNVAPEFNRPTDWSRQIRFEPGAIIGYEQRRRALAYDAGPMGFDVLPSVSVKRATWRPPRRSGLQTRTGLALAASVAARVGAGFDRVGRRNIRARRRCAIYSSTGIHCDRTIASDTRRSSGRGGRHRDAFSRALARVSRGELKRVPTPPVRAGIRGRRSSPASRSIDDRRADQVIELRILAVDEGVSARQQWPLLPRSHAAA